MNAYVQTLYQIVFATKYRAPVLRAADRKRLFTYIARVLANKRCRCHAVGGVEDHLHVVTHVHQSVAVADLVKDVKLASHAFLEREGLCPDFRAWQVGYAALTYHAEARDTLVRYALRQEAHHAHDRDYRLELARLLAEHRVDFDERYLD